MIFQTGCVLETSIECTVKIHVEVVLIASKTVTFTTLSGVLSLKQATVNSDKIKIIFKTIYLLS